MLQNLDTFECSGCESVAVPVNKLIIFNRQVTNHYSPDQEIENV
jgi:hypothetical protein